MKFLLIPPIVCPVCFWTLRGELAAGAKSLIYHHDGFDMHGINCSRNDKSFKLNIENQLPVEELEEVKP